MVAEIIKIKDNLFVPTTNALAIPEFNLLWKKVKDSEIYFLFIHYWCYPISAYSEVPENQKWDLLKKDFPIDEENPYFIAAKEKAEILYTTPLKRGFLATKKGYDNLSLAVECSDKITFGKDGNATEIKGYIKDSAALMDQYTAAEKKYKEEISSYGSRELGFDDKINYEDDEIPLN